MQIDIEAAARVAPGGLSGEMPAGELVRQRMRWARPAIVLAAGAAVLLASCLAVIMGLS